MRALERGELSKLLRVLLSIVPLLVALTMATRASAAIFVRLARYGPCSGAPIHRTTPPKRPFVFLATTPSGPTRTRGFAVRLPATLRPGQYKIFVWCKSCGGSLIVAGRDSSGQTLRVLR